MIFTAKTTAKFLSLNYPYITCVSDIQFTQGVLYKWVKGLLQQADIALKQSSITAAFRSSIHLLNQTPDAPTLVESARRILCNANFIREGQTIPDWKGEELPVNVGIMDAVREVHKGVEMTHFHFRCLDNLLAGQMFDMSLPDRYVYVLFRKYLGLSRLMEGIDPLYLAGMSFQATIYKDVEGYIAWKTVSANQDQKKANRNLINDRREKAGRCDHADNCYSCQHTRKQCRLAVHL